MQDDGRPLMSKTLIMVNGSPEEADASGGLKLRH
jgi:hypothetical protein